MRISLVSELEARRELIRLIEQCDWVDVAVAWAGQNSVVRTLLSYHAKLRHVVIGTHMYQTDPEVLRSLMPYGVGCMPPDGRLFHPKVYFFDLGETVAALVGSHNMTSSAFDGKNVEASVLMQGSKDEAVFLELAQFIASAWSCSEDIDEEQFLFAYEAQYKLNREKRKALERFQRVNRPQNDPGSTSSMELTWEAYLTGLQRPEIGSPNARLEILETARALFEDKSSLVNMERDERRAIAGTYGSKEKGLGSLSWESFGTMFGAGTFKNLINEAPEKLSVALDHIPLDGEVRRDDYLKFAKQFSKAFAEKSRKGGLPTASRLLALKRPDLFIGVNSANKKGIAKAFGSSVNSIDLNTYWDKIVVPTQLSPWWCHARPGCGVSQRIWENRAALIDAHYYAAS